MLSGMVDIRLTTADAAGAMDMLLKYGASFENIEPIDELTLQLRVSRKDAALIHQLAKRYGYSLEVTGVHGLYISLLRLAGRPVLIAGLLTIMVLSIWLQSRVLFIFVQGNELVPTAKILEQCEQSGLGFGVIRREVRSQKIKDALLEDIPQLQWVGVTTNGCVATVSVRERRQNPIDPTEGKPTCLIASCDGVITQRTVTQGSALCQIGQSVKKGQKLVSGYTDCGLCIRAQRARGEIFATTLHQSGAVVPVYGSVVAKERSVTQNYAIIIGKKRINFYKGSGISGMTCDKMYSERYVTLPGGFRLPIKLVVETWYEGSINLKLTEEDTVHHSLLDFVRFYLKSQMVAGSIITENVAFSCQDGICRLDGDFICHEMIALECNEEIIEPNGNDD